MSVILGAALIFVFNWVITGQIFPFDAEPERWLLLGISGICGFWFSFLLVIKSFLYIGPRLGLLVGSLSPVLSAILAWWLLDETLNSASVMGIVVTIAGVIVVISAKAENGMAKSHRDYQLGVGLAVASSFTRAVALVLSKPGLSDDFPAITGSLMRIIVAVIAMLIYMALRGEFKSFTQGIQKSPMAFRQAALSALIGPAIGATLLLFAVQQAEVGVASTLGNLTPIFLLPIGYVVFKERITRRAVLGTVVAFVGTTILFIG
jgi:drug/metabolite transporter (DMT)-like permease